MPENVNIFSNFLSIASGDIEEFNSYIPNISDYIIDSSEVIEDEDNSKFYQKFQDDNMSPYFIIAFG